MAEKLSKLFLEKKQFHGQDNVLLISVADAETYAELILNEWYSEVGELTDEDEEWMNDFAAEEGITDYEI